MVVLLLPELSACGGGDKAGDTSTTSGAPTIAKVRMWLTLNNDPNASPVTTLTPEQTAQASIWARGTTEENITFKVNLNYNSKLTTIANNVHIEGSSKAVGIGGFASPLEPGKYTFQALSGAFGSVIGSLDITVVLASPPDTSIAPSTTAPPQITQTPVVTAALSEQPDMATYRKYFSDLGLGKTPADAKSPQDIQRNVTIFTAVDYITLYGTIIQEVQISARYYNVATMQSVNAPAPPSALQKGGFASSCTLDLSPGKYEFKVYVGDILVGVFPFEVR